MLRVNSGPTYSGGVLYGPSTSYGSGGPYENYTVTVPYREKGKYLPLGARGVAEAEAIRRKSRELRADIEEAMAHDREVLTGRK